MGYKSLAFIIVSFVFFAVASSDCFLAKQPPQFPKPDIRFKDVRIGPHLCARLYVPKSASPSEKLPIVIYYHGGAFCTFSAFLMPYDNYVHSLVKAAKVIALSVEYRLAPLHPLPAAYEDSWAALKWVASHKSGRGPERWINKQADFGRLFLAGDSAGGNIAHNMAMRMAREKIGVDINGIALIDPYFWGSEPIGIREPRNLVRREIYSGPWMVATAGAIGLDDPRFNPLLDPKLPTLACRNVLVITASLDDLRDRGYYYYKALRTNGWKGKADFMEIFGLHDAHLATLERPATPNTGAMLERLSAFFHHP